MWFFPLLLKEGKGCECLKNVVVVVVDDDDDDDDDDNDDDDNVVVVVMVVIVAVSWLLNVPATRTRICPDKQHCTCCHAQTQVVDQTYIPSNHSILTPAKPVLALTLLRQTPS